MIDVAAWSVSVLATLGDGAGVGLPHADVDEDVGVEAGDGFDDAVVLIGRDPVERGVRQPPPRRIGVDPGQRADPRFGFEHAGDQRAEFTADPADEDATAAHSGNASRRIPAVTGLRVILCSSCRYLTPIRNAMSEIPGSGMRRSSQG